MRLRLLRTQSPGHQHIAPKFWNTWRQQLYLRKLASVIQAREALASKLTWQCASPQLKQRNRDYCHNVGDIELHAVNKTEDGYGVTTAHQITRALEQ